jgi:Mrp family chromosome partitioning ATPase
MVIAWPVAEQDAAVRGGGDLAAVLAKLRREFAYIVVSAGPVKNSIDLFAISGIVSAVFFIVEAGKTRRDAAKYNLNLLRQCEFEGIRLILNKRIFYIPGWLMRFV